MVVLYYISFWASVLLLIKYVVSEEKNSNNLLLAMICVTISNGGYLALVESRNLEEALLANKMIYAGGCFFPVAGFLITCELCNVKVKRILKAILYSIQLLLYVCVCTIGYLGIYYKTVEFHRNEGISYLTKTYGIAHMLYPLFLYIYMILAAGVLVISIKRKNMVSTKTVLLTFLNYMIVVLTYSLERIFKCNIELVPFAYVFSFAHISSIVRRSAVYSVSNNVQIMFERKKEYGYIQFDKNLRYIGCNVCAMNIIPELKQMPLDRSISYADNLLYHRILPALKAFKDSGEQLHAILKSNGRSYEIQVSSIEKVKGRIRGYAVELTDATEHQKYLDMVEGYNRNLESEVDGKTHKIREMQDKIIMGMAQMVESRDLSTGGHIKRTSAVIKVFSRHLLKENLGFTKEFLYYVQKSAPMHDLGKIAVDDAILRKRGKFTPEEYAIMQRHSAAGARIVNEILTGVEGDEFVRISSNIAHYHHEKVDGSGYPQGLKGDEIPIEARIMALADVFDALVSVRCYKKAFTFDEAFEIIESSIGTHFDEKLGKVFLRCRTELEVLYNGFFEEEHSAHDDLQQ